jgi:F420-non-reducing hydrogenase iron-sulfur subunit
MSSRGLKTCVFYCSNHLQAEQFAALNQAGFRTIGLPCSGKVDVPYLIKAFETGADAVVIIRCKTNECRHFEGNLRANKRAEAVGALLHEIGEDPRRIRVLECPEGAAPQVIGQISQFLETVQNLPQPTAAKESL